MIEFFANYGFNKPHAADYAVITVQTAYLKCHYPQEYMSALLSVQRDDLSKVSTFLEECRRLDITILPPDVNYSQLDFDIETAPDSTRAIRFGLAAVKNAGARALSDLIEQRGAAPFASLVDFCQRVDMRKLGKRTLESLIKVGALDKFGTRATLMAALDGIVGYSSNYHRDQEIGQKVMFGDAAAGDDALLEDLKQFEEYSPRELLKWEKELLGLYLTGRPVDRYRQHFLRQKLHSISDLKSPALPKPETFRVAGEITALRKLTTKTGEPMAVLTLEDWHDSAGAIEVVLFPRTYDKVTAAMADAASGAESPIGLAEGEIVLIRGRYDDGRGEPQIIADDLSFDFHFAINADILPETLGEDEPTWALADEGPTNGHAAPYDEPPDLPPPDLQDEALSDQTADPQTIAPEQRNIMLIAPTKASPNGSMATAT